MHPYNSRENKRKNRNNVLKMLLLYSPISRIELAKRTGLSKMTLTNIMNEFLEEGLVEEREKDQSTTSGRKPIFLSFPSHPLTACGIYLSRRAANGCLLTAAGEMVHRQSIPLSADESVQTLSDKICLLANSLMIEGKNYPLVGIGIGAIGPVDTDQGVLLNPPAFYGIHNFPLISALKKQTKLPVFLDNDMNASALAEMYFGCCKETKDFIYIGVTYGIGAGIVSGGRLLMGEGGVTGEIGHTTMDINGSLCPCGSRGCLELYADAKNTAAYYTAQAKTESSLAYEDVVALALSGDSLAREALFRQFRYLGAAITNLANLFDPGCIILGHEIAAAGSFAQEEIAKYAASKMLSSAYRDTPLRISSFGADAPLVGAGALVFHRLFQ